MMKQQPDKLFSDKLAAYARPVPTRAWDAIEEKLDKRSRKALWLKLAASLLLLGTASYVLWSVYETQGEQHSHTMADRHTPIVRHTNPAHRDTVSLTAPVVETAPALQNTIASRPAVPQARITPGEKAEHVPATHTEEETTVAIAETEKPAPSATTYTNTTVPPAEVVAVATADNTTTAPVAAANTGKETSHNITLVYTANEADAYLDKSGLAKATSEEEKSSTLKKLLKKAADLKSNQDPLGELRQRKNEILALNFRSEKQRGQNK